LLSKLDNVVREVPVDSDNACVFCVDKKLVGLTKDVLLICSYIQPENSPFYTKYDIDDGISLLESLIADVMLMHDGYLFVCGDLNARTSNNPYVISCEQNCFDLEDILDDSNDVTYTRNSQDYGDNSYGKMLLKMCSTFGLCILNGACEGDHDGRYTFVSDSGNSVIDYFLVSDDIFSYLVDNCILRIDDRFESCHFPVCLQLPVDNTLNQNKKEQNNSYTRVVWQSDREQLVKQCFLCDEVQTKLKIANNLVKTDVNLALDLFNECMRDCSKCMEKKVCYNAKQKKKTWFDDKCVKMRRNLRKLLRKFRKTLSSEDRFQYCKTRREYKHLLNAKKKQYKDKQFSELLESLADQSEFWKKIKRLSPRIVQPHDISIDTWHNHFKKVLEVNDTLSFDELDVNDNINHTDDTTEAFINGPITAEEICSAIKTIKTGKACGPDGIVGELFKNYSTNVIDFFVNLFNELYDTGVYPENWTHSIIQPLFKKGDTNNPNNYRGIFLSDISGKLYSKIINCRLQKWIDQNNCIGEHQAGFRKDYSTIDHIFTLMALNQK
jgi:hypothetical protein